MIEILAAIVFVLFVWWFATGAVLHASRVVKTPLSGRMAVLAGAICLLAWTGVALSSATLSTGSVVVAFVSVIVIWGWHEFMFLTGALIGSRRQACPAEAEGVQRFRYAFAVLDHHEIALFLSLVVMAVVTWGGDNLYGLTTFLVLWLMRLSAKFNLYVGVPHFSDELLPDQLSYLSSYFRKRPVSAFYWASLALAVGTAAGLVAWLVFFAANLTPADVVGLVLVTSLLVLAIVEHAFMAIPFQESRLWRWAEPGLKRSRSAPTKRNRGPQRQPGRSAKMSVPSSGAWGW